MHTYIDTKQLIPEILDLGWMVKNDTWTDCPWAIYDQLQADSKLLDALMSVGVDNWEEEWIQLLKYWKRK